MNLNNEMLPCGWCGEVASYSKWKHSSTVGTLHCPHCGSLTSVIIEGGMLTARGPAGSPDIPMVETVNGWR